LNENKYIKIEKRGNSQNEKPIFLLKISDFDKPIKSKNRVFIHARTHPAETPPSFLIEGMIDYLQTESSIVKNILSEFEFYIFPMQNVDGVNEGNYRTTPQTENLEVMWNYDNENPLNLIAPIPLEINLLHNYAKNLMISDEPKVSMALNLHASNSEPDIRPFFFPHFGTEDQGYSTKEASLWNKQIRFITAVGSHHGMDMIEPIPTEGGSSFASKTYPESWWWVNFQDEVMAITMELTYGRSGYSPKWIEPDDIRDLGKSLVLGIVDYYNESFDPKPYMLKSGNNNSMLKYPDLYPPKATDELKE
jgi:hypothetical protein